MIRIWRNNYQNRGPMHELYKRLFSDSNKNVHLKHRISILIS